MSNEPMKNPLNAQGKYYVTDDCLACEVCVDDAPDIFRMDNDTGMSYVYKQPTTPEEEKKCQEAILTCCVEAIRGDGEQ
jgi:ferredoxin